MTVVAPLAGQRGRDPLLTTLSSVYLPRESHCTLLVCLEALDTWESGYSCVELNHWHPLCDGQEEYYLDGAWEDYKRHCTGFDFNSVQTVPSVC